MSGTIAALRSVLIVNPHASGVDATTIELVAGLWRDRFPTEVLTTTGKGSAIELARAAQGADIVAALGGDGTLNEVVNGLRCWEPHPPGATPGAAPPASTDRLATALGALGASGREPLFVPLPGGSTNVFTRSLGLPRRPLEAAVAALSAVTAGEVARLGLGLVNGRRFLTNAGFGLDASIAARADGRPARKRRWGALWFAACAALEVLGAYDTRQGRRPRLRPALDLQPATGKPDLECAWVVVLNRSGRRSAPYTYAGRRAFDLLGASAGERDGLTVICFDRARFGQLSAATWRSLALGQGASHVRGVDVVDIDGPAHLDATTPVAAQVDGDSLAPATHFEIGFERGALITLRPRSPRA